MNNLPFPPVVLTHITKNNALFHKACKSGVNIFIETHHLSHLTAVSVATLLKSNQLTPDEIHWIKFIAGLNLETGDEEGYGYGDGVGYGYRDGVGYGDGDEYGDGYGDGCGDGCGDGYGDGCGYGYGYGYNYGNGYGYGYGYDYGNGNGNGNGN